VHLAGGTCAVTFPSAGANLLIQEVGPKRKHVYRSDETASIRSGSSPVQRNSGKTHGRIGHQRIARSTVIWLARGSNTQEPVCIISLSVDS